MPNSQVPFVPHFDFSTLEQTIVRESFARFEGSTKAIYAGVQQGRWAGDEFVWNERRGAWSDFKRESNDPELVLVGTPSGLDKVQALRTVAANISLTGASVEEYRLPSSMARGDGNNIAVKEPLLRITTGQPLQAVADLTYSAPEEDYYAEPAKQWFLYSATTGQLIISATDGKLGVVPNGSYLLWSSAGNEYSAIRVRVGSGNWIWDTAVYPGPGCPLFRKTGGSNVVINSNNAAAFIVPFDPLARVVSASCILHSPVRMSDGEFELNEGSLLIAGIRASRSGPQSALWLLRQNKTARLLAVSPTYSDGRCECSKTNHFASDIGQHPDGRIFFLSECDLKLYVPDGANIYERFVSYPESSHGHPGGQCLRFPNGEVAHWTENFGGVNNGTSWYNRLVRRVGGRDVPGPSSLWHGPNCAESYLGRYFAIRSDDGKSQLLDTIEGGRWSGFSGIERSLNGFGLKVVKGVAETKADSIVEGEGVGGDYWQRLRASGPNLYIFGYRAGKNPESGNFQWGFETPTVGISDGLMLRGATLPCFVRRVTCSALDGAESLLLSARASADGIGPANLVAEIPNSNAALGMRVCSFWNENQNAFMMSRPAFIAAGGDSTKLPAYFRFVAQAGANAGGLWVPSDTAPTVGSYLQTQLLDSTTIRILCVGTLPYSAAIWGELCFEILDDGSIGPPQIETTCGNAQCVFDLMPEGTKFRFIDRPIPTESIPATIIQIADRSNGERLSIEREHYPTLWYRIDSEALRNDLISYTNLTHYTRSEVLAIAAKQRIEVVVLIAPENQPLDVIELPSPMRLA